MPRTLQTYLESATPNAAKDLIAAFMRLPEDKRAWSPMGDARTALDQIAECAILNGYVAQTLKSHKFIMGDDYVGEKKRVQEDWDALKALFEENTANAVAAIAQTPDEDLDIQVTTPWGEPMKLSQIAAYPFWNMCYHEGQINYIASMLGCLE